MPSQIMRKPGQRNTTPNIRPSRAARSASSVKSHEPRTTPATPTPPSHPAARKSRLRRTRCPKAPDAVVKITANSVVAMATGMGYPSQEWTTGSMTLHPPVPISPPSNPARNPTTTKTAVRPAVMPGIPITSLDWKPVA